MKDQDRTIRIARRVADIRAADLGLRPDELLGEAWLEAWTATDGGQNARSVTRVAELVQDPYYIHDDETAVEPYDLVEEVETRDLQDAVRKALRDLTQQEATVVALRHGIDCDDPMTFAEIAAEIGQWTSVERGRQIYLKGMRRLTHPARMQHLGSLLDGWDVSTWKRTTAHRGLRNGPASVWEVERPQEFVFPPGASGGSVYEGLPLGRHGSAASLVTAVLKAVPEIAAPRLRPRLTYDRGTMKIDGIWTVADDDLPDSEDLRLDMEEGFDVSDIARKLAAALRERMLPTIDPTRLDTPCPASLFEHDLRTDGSRPGDKAGWAEMQAARAGRMLLDALRGYDPDRYAMEAARRALALHVTDEAVQAREERTKDRRASMTYRYTHGECMVLAMNLSVRDHLPMVGIYDDVWKKVPRHVGVQRPCGLYADARGARLDRTAFLEGYRDEGTEIRPITAREVDRIWGRRITSWLIPDADLRLLGLDQRSLAT